MVTVDLITGFLGAGKTTFIHKYIDYLKSKGESIRIIENEFGDSNIDTHFLEDEHLEIEDLAGMCMCCVGKGAFINMLKESAASTCDRIIVEPSGIYDVDEFFETLSLPELQQVLEIGSIITIVDPYSLDNLSKESRYLMFSQLLASGCVLMSKTQYLSDIEIEEAKEKIDRLMKEFGCESGLLADLYTTPWNELTDSDMEDISDSYYNRFIHDRYQFNHMEVYDSIEVKVVFDNKEDMISRIQSVFDHKECGLIYRIKGYAIDSNNQVYEVNCTPKTTSVKEVDSNQQLELIVIGEHIRRKKIMGCLNKS